MVIVFKQVYSKRPVILNTNGAYFLFDTGADIPVWVAPEKDIYKYYPNAKLTEDTESIDGFGGKATTKSPIYEIPEFCISNGDKCFIFYNLKVACRGLKSNYHMIINYPMIQSMGIKFHTDYMEADDIVNEFYENKYFNSVTVCTIQKAIDAVSKQIRSIIELTDDHELEELLKEAGYNNQLSTFLRVFPDGATDLSNAQILDKFKETIPQPTPYTRGELI